MRKIRKAKVLNNGSPLISDSLINVGSSSILVVKKLLIYGLNI